MKRILLVFGFGVVAAVVFSKVALYSQEIGKSSQRDAAFTQEMSSLAEDMLVRLHTEEGFKKFVAQFAEYQKGFADLQGQKLPLLFDSFEYFRQHAAAKRNTVVLYLATFNEIILKLLAQEPVSLMLKNKLSALGSLLR